MSLKIPNKKQSKYDFLKFWGMTVPLILAAGLLGYLGHLLDQWLKFEFPLFTLLGIFAGILAAVIQLLKMLNKK